MFRLTAFFLIAALHAIKTTAVVPTSCQVNQNGFVVTEETYASQLVAFQVASSPPSLNISDQYLTLAPLTPYSDILNLTITPSLSSATRFTPIYQRASQSPKSGAWSCAWHRFLAPGSPYNATVGVGSDDVQLSILNWEPSPLLVTSYAALKTNLKQDWRYTAYGFRVLRNGEGDTRVLGTAGRPGFLAYAGDDGRVVVGYTEADHSQDEKYHPIELKMVVVSNATLV